MEFDIRTHSSFSSWVNLWAGNHHGNKRTLCVLKSQQQHLCFSQKRWFTGTGPAGHPAPFLPESVSNTVPKIKEVLVILDHEVSCIEVDISLLKNVKKQLAFRVPVRASVAKERILSIDTRDEKSGFSCKRAAIWADKYLTRQGTWT